MLIWKQEKNLLRLDIQKQVPLEIIILYCCLYIIFLYFQN